VSRKE
jgi:hypothetical protein